MKNQYGICDYCSQKLAMSKNDGVVRVTIQKNAKDGDMVYLKTTTIKKYHPHCWVIVCSRLEKEDSE